MGVALKLRVDIMLSDKLKEDLEQFCVNFHNHSNSIKKVHF